MPENLERSDECPSCATDVGDGVRYDSWNNCPFCGHVLNKDDYEIEVEYENTTMLAVVLEKLKDIEMKIDDLSKGAE